MLTRDDILAPSFPVYFNKKMYKLDWFQKPNLKTINQIDVGIDQSSSCTGLCLKNIDLTMIMELPRGDMTMSEYKQALTQQLDILLDGYNVRHFIFEKHGRHISPLHALINEITDEIKKYTKPLVYDDVYIKGVLPSVWRSGFLDKEVYAGQFKREQVKWACVQEAIRQEPELEQYIKYAHKKDGVPDYDGFEAFGIISGFLKLNYAEDGTRIINSSMEFRNGRKFDYTIFPTTEYELYDELREIKSRYASRSCVTLLSNNKLLLDNSLNRVLDDYKDAVIIVDKNSPEIPRLIIETNKEFNPEDRYLIYVRAS